MQKLYAKSQFNVKRAWNFVTQWSAWKVQTYIVQRKLFRQGATRKRTNLNHLISHYTKKRKANIFLTSQKANQSLPALLPLTTIELWRYQGAFPSCHGLFYWCQGAFPWYKIVFPRWQGFFLGHHGPFSWCTRVLPVCYGVFPSCQRAILGWDGQMEFLGPRKRSFGAREFFFVKGTILWLSFFLF